MLLSTQQDAFHTLAAAGQKLRQELRSVLQVRHSLLHFNVVAPDDEVWRYLVYLKHWNLNLRPLMV